MFETWLRKPPQIRRVVVRRTVLTLVLTLAGVIWARLLYANYFATAIVAFGGATSHVWRLNQVFLRYAFVGVFLAFWWTYSIFQTVGAWKRLLREPLKADDYTEKRLFDNRG